MFLFALFFFQLLGTIGAMEEIVMGKIVLYLAISVDGYLADEQGGVDWLVGDGSEPDAPGSYPAFLDTVDAIVMGWTTYHQLVTELSPDSWPYEGRPCYVVTNRQEEDQKGIFFQGGELASLVDAGTIEDFRGDWLDAAADKLEGK